MDGLDWLDVVSRIFHVLTAITLVGGSLYAAMVVGPVLRANATEVADQWQAALTAGWKKWVHGGIALFLLTGFYNYIRAMPLHKGDGLYHALIGTKILLALAVMVIASGLVGRSRAFQFMRDGRRTWQGILLVLAVVIVSMSGFLKVRASLDRPAPATAAQTSAESVAS
jgi:hypothetical protein